MLLKKNVDMLDSITKIITKIPETSKAELNKDDTIKIEVRKGFLEALEKKHHDQTLRLLGAHDYRNALHSNTSGPRLPSYSKSFF
mgnify:FL=1